MARHKTGKLSQICDFLEIHAIKVIRHIARKINTSEMLLKNRETQHLTITTTYKSVHFKALFMIQEK